MTVATPQAQSVRRGREVAIERERERETLKQTRAEEHSTTQRHRPKRTVASSRDTRMGATIKGQKGVKTTTTATRKVKVSIASQRGRGGSQVNRVPQGFPGRVANRDREGVCSSFPAKRNALSRQFGANKMGHPPHSGSDHTPFPCLADLFPHAAAPTLVQVVSLSLSLSFLEPDQECTTLIVHGDAARNSACLSPTFFSGFLNQSALLFASD